MELFIAIVFSVTCLFLIWSMISLWSDGESDLLAVVLKTLMSILTISLMISVVDLWISIL